MVHASYASELVSPGISQLLNLPDGTMLALSQDKAGLFFSTDNGEKWRQASNLPDDFLCSISLDMDGDLYLTAASGVYLSSDRGARWEKISTLQAASLSFTSVQPFCMVKIWGDGLFLCRIHKNTFDEATMTRIDPKSKEPVQCVAQGKGGDSYAGFFGKGVYQSMDRGRSWSKINRGLTNTDVLILESGPSGAVFAGTYGGGIFRWYSDQRIWSKVDTGLTRGIVQSMAFGRNGIIFAGSLGEGMIISKDDGITWQRIIGLPDASTVQALAVGSDGSVYAGVYGRGLYVSRDSGQNWRHQPFAYVYYVERLAYGPDGRWYAGVKGLGWLMSKDKGFSWSAVDFPFPEESDIPLVISEDRLFTGSKTHGAFVSSDNGQTWENVSQGLPPGEGINALRGNGKGHVFSVPTDGKGIFQWHASSGWKKIIADEAYGDNYSAWDLMFLPDDEVLVWGYNDILVSSGNLSTWKRSRFGQAFRGIWVDPDLGFWTQRAFSTFVRHASGSEWESRTRIPENRYIQFAKLGINSDQLIGVRMDKGMDLLQRSGSRWEPMTRMLGDKQVLTAIVDADGTILAGTTQGLWVSRDSGRTWQEVEVQR